MNWSKRAPYLNAMQIRRACLVEIFHRQAMIDTDLSPYVVGVKFLNAGLCSHEHGAFAVHGEPIRDRQRIIRRSASLHATPQRILGPILLAAKFYEKFGRHPRLSWQLKHHAPESLDPPQTRPFELLSRNWCQPSAKLVA